MTTLRTRSLSATQRTTGGKISWNARASGEWAGIWVLEAARYHHDIHRSIDNSLDALVLEPPRLFILRPQITASAQSKKDNWNDGTGLVSWLEGKARERALCALPWSLILILMVGCGVAWYGACLALSCLVAFYTMVQMDGVGALRRARDGMRWNVLALHLRASYLHSNACLLT